MDSTDEQTAIIEAFKTGDSLVVEAGAGTGKTTTLRMLAQSTDAAGQYVAFNRAIVDEAKTKFPAHIRVSTAHSLAYGKVGYKYKKRLAGGRMRSHDVAALLGLSAFRVTNPIETKTLSPSLLASQVMKGIDNFCFSADPEPKRKHLPYIDGIDLPDSGGKRTFANNNIVQNYLEPYLIDAWKDLSKISGKLPFKHDAYLKLWQLQEPHIGTEFIMFDECQDAAPVMLAAINAQEHAQLVFVGDSQQQIYEWRGAVNALASANHLQKLFLSQSFRFGEAIADVANIVLDHLGAELRLSGLDSLDSRVASLTAPKATLCRTNGTTVDVALRAQARGQSVHLVGAGAEVASFVRAAGDLQKGWSTTHPDLACFSSWDEVRNYARLDPQGRDLKMMVLLVDQHGVEKVLESVNSMCHESQADLVVSTAHRSKGREWGTVQIANDFPDDSNSEGEWRLLYVAATRAKNVLDIDRCKALSDMTGAVSLFQSMV